MKPGPKPLSGTTMTQAERQARHRASLAQVAPKIRYRKPADRRSRPQRWRDAVAELLTLQGYYHPAGNIPDRSYLNRHDPPDLWTVPMFAVKDERVFRLPAATGVRI